MWHRSETYWLLDRTIRVRSESDAFSEGLAEVLKHARSSHAAARGRDSYLITRSDDDLEVFRDCSRVLETPSLDQALDLFLADLNRHILYSFDGYAAHAGVVAHPNGRVAAIPGTSGHGKSTLTAACVMAGFRYLSDEALCVDYGSTEALPYLKPINLLDWSRHHLGIDSDAIRERPISPTTLGQIQQEPAHITDIVHLDRPGTIGIEPVGSNSSVGTLIEMSFNHYRAPEQTFRTVTGIASEAKSWRLSYEEPTSAARLLFETLS